MTHPDFWNNQQAAQVVINETNALKETVGELAELNDSYENLDLTFELVKEESDEELDLNYCKTSYSEEVPYALSNSLGFGGHNASILIGKYTE